MTISQFPDAEDSSQAAARFAEYKTQIRRHLAQVRERMIAVCTAELIGIPTAPAEYAMSKHLDQYSPDLMRDLLIFAMHDGMIPAADEAKARLLQLRDVNDVQPIERVTNGG